mgnify:CR=1 FL=1
MKHIFKSALLLLMTISLFAACDDDHDSNPTLTAPTEFRLNTPALANVPIDLANSETVELTCSQPNYGFPASTQYTIQVSLNSDMSNAVDLDDKPTSAKLNIEAATLASTLTNMEVALGKEENDFPMDITAYFRVKAQMLTSDGNAVEGTEILSNTVSLNKIHLLYSLPPVKTPDHVYAVGSFCGWDWGNCFDMIKVNSAENIFWHLIYIDGSGFKINTDTSWNGNDLGYAGVTISGECKDDIIESGGNIASKNPGWYLVIVTTSVSGRNILYDVQFNKPEVWLMGPVVGNSDWKELAEGWSFTVPTTADGDFVSPAFAGDVPGGDGDGVRAYVKIPGYDWWKSEFMVFDKKIEYRSTGGDQARVAGSVGQKLYLNFAKGTGEIK